MTADQPTPPRRERRLHERRQGRPAPKVKSDEEVLADRLEAALGRAEQKLVDLGMAAPNRTREAKRARRAGRRQPGDKQQDRAAVVAARRSKAKAARKAAKGKR